MGYFIAVVAGAFFGVCTMGLFAASGIQNTREEAYEQGKKDALKDIISNNK